MAEQGIRSRRSLLLGLLLGVAFVAAGMLELRQLSAWSLRTAAVRRTALREAYRLSRFPADYRAAFEANHLHALGRLLSRAQSLMAGADTLQARETSADPALKSLISQLGQVRPLLAEAVARTAAARGSLEKTFQAVHAARIALPLYRLSARRLADRLESVGASVAQVLPASRLADEASRLNRRLAAFGRPHTLFRRYANGLRRRARKMEEVTRGLAVGSRRLGLPPVRDPAFSPALRSLSALFAPVARGVGLIVDQAKVLDPIESSWSGFTARLPALKVASARVLASSHPILRPFWVRPLLAYAFLGIGLAVLVMLLVGWRLVGEIQVAQRARLQEARRNQNAILQLLDELAGLADGDLTVQASVTEDITGAIADSVNFAVEQLRGLVRTINQTAVRIDDAARSTNTTAQELVQAATLQSRQIRQASVQVTTMARSIEQVSTNAQQAAQVAQRSVSIAHRGADAVRATIEGMNTIRESIQETAKRIKRLGESSQEIGDIVELINDIAEQTNILALNASIQASAAGEAGRGFAVVADEVQRLAERAGNATRQIETLVKAIQNDTGEAVDSMEKSTSGVVNGAQLAENAGRALSEIETVSGHIATIVKTISEAARQQAVASGEVTAAMDLIQKITTQTTEGTQTTVQDIATLTQLASDLRRTVSGFKLPEELGPSEESLPETPTAPPSGAMPPELHEEVDLIPELALAGR